MNKLSMKKKGVTVASGELSRITKIQSMFPGVL